MDFLDVGLNLTLEILDLHLILLSELLHVLVECLVLPLLFLSQSLVLSQQFDLLLEYLLIVGGHAMQDFILTGVFLCDLAVHLV